MPYSVVPESPDCPPDTPFAVVNDDDESVEGCFASEDDANAKVADLYAAEGGPPPPPPPPPPKKASVAGARHWTKAPGVADRAENDPVLRAIYTAFADAPVSPGETPEPETLPIDAYTQGKWEGVLAVEGVETGDSPKREFAAGALDWRDLPLSIYWQKQTGDGHDNAVIVARVDTIERDGNKIVGSGQFDMGGADGIEAHRLIHGGYMRGISVSLDDVGENDLEEVYGDAAGEGDGGGLMMMPMPEKVIFHHGRIVDACLTGQPALQEASIHLVPDQVDAPVTRTVPALAAGAKVISLGQPNWNTAGSATSVLRLTTSSTTGTALVAAGGPAKPPKAWFEDPHLQAPTPLTVTPDGRIFGHLAQFGTCHMSFTKRCVQPPRNDDFSYFNLKAIPTAEGDYVSVGNLTFGGDHAPIDLDMVPAKEHYENTSSVIADVHAGQDRFGIWIAGAARPGLTAVQMRTLQGASVSGDWRYRDGRHRLVHGLLVNVPGFPVPRLRTYVHNGVQTALVASGIVTAASAERFRLANVNDRIAKSIGRDHPSRRAAAFAKVHRELPSA